MDFLEFFDVEMPNNVVSFMENFEGDPFTIIPNLLETDEEGLCKMNLYLEQKGLKCLSVNNIGSQLMQIMGVLAFKVFVFFLGLFTLIKSVKRFIQPSE